MEIPEALSRAIRERLSERLGFSPALVAAATHVHSSVGGYDANLAAAAAATGSFSSGQFEAIADAAAQAAAQAFSSLSAARLRTASRPLPGLSKNRDDPGGPVDDVLRALFVEHAEAPHAPIAAAFSFNAHATLIPRASSHLDADFPGRAAAAIEQALGAPALFFQGTAGDAGAVPPPLSVPESGGAAKSLPETARRAQAMADALAAAVLTLERASETPPHWTSRPGERLPLAFARTTFTLPRTQAPATVPPALATPAAKLLRALLMDSASASLLRLGPLTFVFLPGEPTYFMGQNLRAALRPPPTEAGSLPIVIIGLADGYIGYMESADRRRLGVGESKRMLWESDLEARLTDALSALDSAASLPTSDAAP